MAYLRMTIAESDVDLDSAEGQRLVALIRDEGPAVFRQQPGSVRYRLMRAEGRRTVAVAEWESEDLGTRGAANFRTWLESAGIKSHLVMDTYAGTILVAVDSEADEIRQ